MDDSSASLADRLKLILNEIGAASIKRDSRLPPVQLVAVSKQQPISLIQEYEKVAESLGIRVVLGENYVQEIIAKHPLLKPPSAIHMIGPLQSNKVKHAVAYCDNIQSVHSEKILQTINQEGIKLGKHQRVMLQVNVSQDLAKSGIAVDQVASLMELSMKLSNISVTGFMTIGALDSDAVQKRRDYRLLRQIAGEMQKQFSFDTPSGIPDLSMGMSDDFALAIEEGATHVRVGTALFGPRYSA